MSSNPYTNDCLKEAMKMATNIVPYRDYTGWGVANETRKDDLLRFTIFVDLSSNMCKVNFDKPEDILEKYRTLHKKLK